MAERARNHTEFAAQLHGLTDLEKVQAAKDVAATIESPGWAVIVDLLESRKARLLDGLVHGPVRSRAEYAAELAEARGIEIALDASQTVLFVAERAAQELSKQSEGAS